MAFMLLNDILCLTHKISDRFLPEDTYSSNQQASLMPEAGGCGGTLLDQRSVLLCDLIHVGNSASDLSNCIALLSGRGADLRNQV